MNNSRKSHLIFTQPRIMWIDREKNILCTCFLMENKAKQAFDISVRESIFLPRGKKSVYLHSKV